MYFCHSEKITLALWNTQRLMSGGTKAQSFFKNKHPTYRQLVAVKTMYMRTHLGL